MLSIYLIIPLQPQSVETVMQHGILAVDVQVDPIQQRQQF